MASYVLWQCGSGRKHFENMPCRKALADMQRMQRDRGSYTCLIEDLVIHQQGWQRKLPGVNLEFGKNTDVFGAVTLPAAVGALACAVDQEKISISGQE